MKNKKASSFFVTLLCAILILSVGYIGIVKSGKMLLCNEEKPQKVTFENTSSNIFYGKIEDDIQLFPWNYYGRNEMSNYVENFVDEPENLSGIEEKLYCMEALHCGVDLDTIEMFYEKKGSGIMDNVSISNTEYGPIFFYQDILELRGEQYQVKIAFSEYMLWSFSCMKYHGDGIRNTEAWEEGKEKLRKILDLYQDEINMCVYDMEYYYLDGFYDTEETDEIMEMADGDNSFYEDCYASAFAKMQKVLEVSSSTDEKVSFQWGEKENEAYTQEEECSYQIIELNDVILLLMQKEYCYGGVYYDPVNQEFCGYNIFMQ
ncbi:hypothetical protein [Roseburia sp. 499]|uniref:hypothetical protein n=1 Tax=Roseburia sp. 499 TaxID=1261634 RepID=UPI0009514449|nr:hypothetical protein [Roseburia sp. 499]WVK68988.1 hypothetical protein BIV20_11440 [Roseburia sp. 499]